MSLQQRLAKLEQVQTGDAGTGVLGVRRIHHRTKTGPDVVTIAATGETLTEGAFRERDPRGLLILRMEYTDTATGDEAACVTRPAGGWHVREPGGVPAMETNAYTRAWFDTFLTDIPAEFTAREVAGLAAWLPLPTFRSILDVCCGTGRHAQRLTALGHAVTGIDRDPVALATARAVVPGAHFVQLDQREIWRVGGQYDAAVILWQSFGYFDAAGNDAVLGQLAARLRPGGRLALDVYHPGYYAARQGRRAAVRPGVMAITDALEGDRLHSTIEYANGTSERMDFELFAPEVLARRAAPFGLTVVGACCWWDAARPPDPDTARYQLILTRAAGRILPGRDRATTVARKTDRRSIDQ